MASPRATAIKTASAVTTIEKASTALAEKFKVEFAPMPSLAKYSPEHARAVQLEHIGNFLQSLALASKSATDEDFAPPPPMMVAAPPPVPEKVEEAAEIVETPKAKSKKKGK